MRKIIDFCHSLVFIVSLYQGPQWKEALKILKLVVTRSSTLVAPPTTVHAPTWESSISSPHPSFNDNEIFTKKELPGKLLFAFFGGGYSCIVLSNESALLNNFAHSYLESMIILLICA